MDTETIRQIRQTIEALRAQHNNAHGSKEQQWIQAHLSDERLQKIILDLSIVALHTLSALESGEQTGIEIAEKINVTRGGVTRAAKKLCQYGLIDAVKHPGDRKKIYYSLTEDGCQVALVHDRLHQMIKRELTAKITAKYSESDLRVVANFLNDFYQLEKKF